MKLKFLFFIFLSFLIFNAPVVFAQQGEEEANSLVLEEINYLLDGQSQSFFGGQFTISSSSGTFSKVTKVVAKKISAPYDWPWNFKPLTVVYEFDLENNGESYHRKQPLNIEIAYQVENNYHKEVFFLDGNSNGWRPLPSVDYPDKQIIKTNLHFPFVRLAVLYTPDVPTLGQASWYAFKNGLFAASPDFPRGSIIRVHNLANGKFVDVTINDYGPDRSIFPNRVIDLDLVAFNRIASAQDGLIDVKLEPRHIALADNDHLFTAGLSLPEIKAQSAIVISENEANILFTKEGGRVAPLASLTKLLAVRVFLDTGVSLDKEIIYLKQDEEYNHQFVRPWESARINLLNGDIIKVRDLLYSSLVGSANNAMETLIRASGLSRQEFIARMNIYAEVWGAHNTSFVEPTGLSRDNMSSPLDYAIIMREALRNPLLAEISTTHIYSFSTVNTNRFFRISNTNQLLRYGQLSLSAAKTGFINASGHCLFSRLEREGDNLLIVTFASENREASYNDHERLARYALRQLENQ